MKQKTNANIVLALLMAFTFIACNDATKDEPAKTDAAKTEGAAMPAYDAAMDPLKVEAAIISRVLADTLNVKFYELIIKPGDSVGLHTHPDHLVYVVEGGIIELKDKDGKAQTVDFKTGMGVVTVPTLIPEKIQETLLLKW